MNGCPEPKAPPSSYSTFKPRAVHSEDLTLQYVGSYTAQVRRNDPQALASIVRTVIPSFELQANRYKSVLTKLEKQSRYSMIARTMFTLANFASLYVAFVNRSRSALLCILGIFNIAVLPVCWSWRSYLTLSHKRFSFRYDQCLKSVIPLVAHYREQQTIDEAGRVEICDRVEEMAKIHEAIGEEGWARVEALSKDGDGVTYARE